MVNPARKLPTNGHFRVSYTVMSTRFAAIIHAVPGRPGRFSRYLIEHMLVFVRIYVTNYSCSTADCLLFLWMKVMSIMPLEDQTPPRMACFLRFPPTIECWWQICRPIRMKSPARNTNGHLRRAHDCGVEGHEKVCWLLFLSTHSEKLLTP